LHHSTAAAIQWPRLWRYPVLTLASLALIGVAFVAARFPGESLDSGPLDLDYRLYRLRNALNAQDKCCLVFRKASPLANRTSKLRLNAPTLRHLPSRSNHCAARYGERKAIFQAEDWEGPGGNNIPEGLGATQVHKPTTVKVPRAATSSTGTRLPPSRQTASPRIIS
jgi:hypothetical protein